MAEILAPCGGKDSFLVAVQSGANAVYLGLDSFSARKNAENFTSENIAYYACYAHTFGVKVYVCVNTLVKESEFDAFLSTIKSAYLAKVDAFIVQDMFLGKRLKKVFPEIVLHLSTQAGVNNLMGAKMAKDFGFSRVVLARETKLKEIQEISKFIETEVFVQGALCSSFSGHCYMSSFIGGNSGNRGLCRQPCRQKYTYSFSNKEKYSLSLSDLCLASEINKLVEIGVSSFKIEGRMRSAEYVCSAIKLYKTALQGKPFNQELSEVKRTFNRGNFTTGYAFSNETNLISDEIQGNLGEFVQKIAKFKDDKIITNNSFLKDCGFKILRDGVEVGNGKTLSNGNAVSYSGKVLIGDDLYITKDVSLTFEKTNLAKKIVVDAEFFAGKKAKLSCEGVSVYSENLLEKAISSAVDEDSLFENLSRVDVFPFEVEKLNFVSDGVFIPKSKLNALRKSLYEKLFYKDLRTEEIDFSSFYADDEIPKQNVEQDNVRALILSAPLKGIESAFTHLVFAPKNYSKAEIDFFLSSVCNFKGEKYLYIPAFLTENEIENAKPLCASFDGLYVEGAFGIELAKSINKKIFGGIELNVFNSIDAKEIIKLGVSNYCLSKELSANELKGLNGCVFSLGSIKLMSLIYCPNKRNCKNCNVEDYSTLTDFGKREFSVRRYKTDECRFEIFNESILVSKNTFKNMIFDFSGLNESSAQTLMNNYLKTGLNGLNTSLKKTNGNLVKGTI